MLISTSSMEATYVNATETIANGATKDTITTRSASTDPVQHSHYLTVHHDSEYH